MGLGGMQGSFLGTEGGFATFNGSVWFLWTIFFLYSGFFVCVFIPVSAFMAHLSRTSEAFLIRYWSFNWGDCGLGT